MRGVRVIPLVLVLAASSTNAQTDGTDWDGTDGWYWDGTEGTARGPLDDLSNQVSGFSLFGPDSKMGENLGYIQQGVKNVLGGVVGVDGKHSNCLQKIICKVRKKSPSTSDEDEFMRLETPETNSIKVLTVNTVLDTMFNTAFGPMQFY